MRSARPARSLGRLLGAGARAGPGWAAAGCPLPAASPPAASFPLLARYRVSGWHAGGQEGPPHSSVRRGAERSLALPRPLRGGCKRNSAQRTRGHDFGRGCVEEAGRASAVCCLFPEGVLQRRPCAHVWRTLVSRVWEAFPATFCGFDQASRWRTDSPALLIKNPRDGSQRGLKIAPWLLQAPQPASAAKASRVATASSVPSRLRRGPPEAPPTSLSPASLSCSPMVPGARPSLPPSLPPRASSRQSPRALLPLASACGVKGAPSTWETLCPAPCPGGRPGPQRPLNTVVGLFTMSPVRCGHLAVGLARSRLQASRVCHLGSLWPRGGATAGRVSADRPVQRCFLHSGLSLQDVHGASPWAPATPPALSMSRWCTCDPWGGWAMSARAPCISDVLAHLPFGLGLGWITGRLVLPGDRAWWFGRAMLHLWTWGYCWVGALNAGACPLPPDSGWGRPRSLHAQTLYTFPATSARVLGAGMCTASRSMSGASCGAEGPRHLPAGLGSTPGVVMGSDTLCASACPGPSLCLPIPSHVEVCLTLGPFTGSQGRGTGRPHTPSQRHSHCSRHPSSEAHSLPLPRAEPR